MVKRSGNLKVNFAEIARELGISVMTLYRVVNQAPSVSSRTRSRVIEALNRHGYFTHKRIKQVKILFDFNEHVYLRWMGEQLIRRLPQNEYFCRKCNHRERPQEFLNAAAECDVAVFCSIPEQELIENIRKINPDLYTVTLTTESIADVTITPNNKLGGELVAKHLFDMGQDHIAVFLSETHPTRMTRYKSFRGEMAVLNPECRIDEIYHAEGESFRDVMEAYFAKTDPCPGVIFFPAGGYAQIFWETFVQNGSECFANIGIMSYDRPCDIFFDMTGIQFFDRIEFVPQQILDWAEYYITNRPMMKKRSPVHTCVNSYLVREGSVKNRRDTLCQK